MTAEGEIMNIEISLKEINGKEVPAVTSLQMAEAFGKRHDNVIRDIRETVSKCSESFAKLNFELSSYSKALGDGVSRDYAMYLLSKDGLMMVTMSYTTPEAMAVKEAYIARFNEMEEQLRNSVPGLPDFQNPALAARAWAEQYERRQIAEGQRDEAIRTKSWINNKKTATAMATASAAVRKVCALEDELGRGKRYKTVKAIPWLPEEFMSSKGMYSVVGKALKRLSADLEYAVEKIATPEFPEGVNAYHVDVIAAFRAELAQNPGMLDRYRRRDAA